MAGIEVNIAPATAVRLTNSRRVIGCIQTSSEVQQRPSQGLFTPGLLVVGSYQVAERISEALSRRPGHFDWAFSSGSLYQRIRSPTRLRMRHLAVFGVASICAHSRSSRSAMRLTAAGGSW